MPPLHEYSGDYILISQACHQMDDQRIDYDEFNRMIDSFLAWLEGEGYMCGGGFKLEDDNAPVEAMGAFAFWDNPDDAVYDDM